MTTTVENSKPAPAFVGIYGAPEAARYINAADCAEKALRVTSTGLRRWIRMGLASPGLVDVRGADLTLNFEDLISLRAIAALRGAGVGWTKIKKAHSWLREATGAARPFASEYFWTGQTRASADWTARRISADRNGRMAFDTLRKCLIPTHCLTFDESAGMAATWTPAKGVWIHPRIQCGSSCIEGTRIPTGAIYGMVIAGDRPRFVAKSYRISMEYVEAALDWEFRVKAA